MPGDIYYRLYKRMQEYTELWRPLVVESPQPLVGRILFMTKKALANLASPLLRILFQRQYQFNRLTTELIKEISSLQERVTHLERELREKRLP